MMGSRPLVSIIVPSRNSDSTLSRCLESVRNQTYKDVEIIVVDNYSDDRTVEIAKTFRATIIVKPDTERSEQCNYGAKLARGKYLYRIDSDFVLEPTVIEEAVRECEEKGFEVVTIHNTSDHTVSLLAEIRNLERMCYADDDIHVAARFLAKAAFERVGGFQESMIAGEDYDLHHRLQRAGYFIGRIRAKEVHLGEYKTWGELIRKHWRYGKDIHHFLEANHKKDRWAIFPLRWIFVKHYKDFLKDARLTAGFVLYTYVRFSAAMLGHLVQMS
jgi:glycosyltransferase involved in cell wall biosynthesis